MNYDEIAELDKLLEDYFALLKDETLDAAVKKTIQDDLTLVTNKWERKQPAQEGGDRSGGLVDLDKRLVEEIGLDWGASYGDVMHFDMRNKGNGVKIYAAIKRYQAEKEGVRGAYAKAHPPKPADAPK